MLGTKEMTIRHLGVAVPRLRISALSLGRARALLFLVAIGHNLALREGMTQDGVFNGLVTLQLADHLFLLLFLKFVAFLDD